ncbi:MAG: hypothetical protein ACYCQJ_00625 [Nitrososphaerales archaeon]
MDEHKKLVVFSLGSFFIFVNFLIFLQALPSIFIPKAPNYASDFSSYYIASWRLFFDPRHLYAGSSVPGEYFINPKPAAFKYLPSFLLLIFPVILTSYQNAYLYFDLFSFFVLLPLVGVLVYKLIQSKSAIVISIVLYLALLEYNFPSYYWQWSQGQDKVLQTFLILLALYLSKTNRTILGSVVFGLTFFDPRFALLATPLFLYYNAKTKKVFFTSIVVGFSTILASNFLFLYQNLFAQFWVMLTSYGIQTPLYAYGFIPLFTILALTMVEGKEMRSTFRSLFSKPKANRVLVSEI